MQSLFQVYRPSSWDEVVGHTPIKMSVNRMKERGSLGGRAFWITGLSGTGKTTIAYLIAGDVCDPGNFLEIDAGDATPAQIDQIEKMVRCRAIGKQSGRAVLINESHGLRKDAIRKLLVVLERIPNHVTWIFTTTNAAQQMLFDGVDSHPLLSRCIQYELKPPRNIRLYAEHLQDIADREGLGGAHIADYERLVSSCSYNLRECLSRIEAGEMLREAVCV